MATKFETNKSSVSAQKLRGGYYTPPSLARYLVNWAIRSGQECILEPSCGDGNFIVAALEHLQENQDRWDIRPSTLVAVEAQRDELAKAASRAKESSNSTTKTEWVLGDFFDAFESLHTQKFDVILGNPPFIRFQHFDEESRKKAFHLLKHFGYKPTKLANVWAAFVQLSIELLAPNGRLAMVIPAEIMQVQYASELRSRLVRSFEHITIVGFKKLVFPVIQQEVILLLAEGKRENIFLKMPDLQPRLFSNGNGSNIPAFTKKMVVDPQQAASDIHTIEFEDGEELISSGDIANLTAHIPAKHSRPGMKWTSLFLEEALFEALDEAEKMPGLKRLGELADVAVGVVTGRNKFFVLAKETVEQVAAAKFTLPIVGKTSALTSISFTPHDFDLYVGKYPAYLLDLTGTDESQFPSTLNDYIESGEKEDIHLGYKCRVRNRWYDVPSIYVPDAFLFRQIHKYPLLVVNEAKAVSTDTIHRVRFNENVDARLVAAASFNSLTLAWAEVCGRSYGGGVLELEPSEARELPIPYSEALSLDFEKVDTLLRRGKYLDALDYVDQIVLHDYLGFSPNFSNAIRSAWIQLRDRRINRQHN